MLVLCEIKSISGSLFLLKCSLPQDADFGVVDVTPSIEKFIARIKATAQDAGFSLLMRDAFNAVVFSPFLLHAFYRYALHVPISPFFP